MTKSSNELCNLIYPQHLYNSIARLLDAESQGNESIVYLSNSGREVTRKKFRSTLLSHILFHLSTINEHQIPVLLLVTMNFQSSISTFSNKRPTSFSFSCSHGISDEISTCPSCYMSWDNLHSALSNPSCDLSCAEELQTLCYTMF